jgi:hypothetical protein
MTGSFVHSQFQPVTICICSGHDVSEPLGWEQLGYDERTYRPTGLECAEHMWGSLEELANREVTLLQPWLSDDDVRLDGPLVAWSRVRRPHGGPVTTWTSSGRGQRSDTPRLRADVRSPSKAPIRWSATETVSRIDDRVKRHAGTGWRGALAALSKADSAQGQASCSTRQARRSDRLRLVVIVLVVLAHFPVLTVLQRCILQPGS